MLLFLLNGSAVMENWLDASKTFMSNKIVASKPNKATQFFKIFYFYESYEGYLDHLL